MREMRGSGRGEEKANRQQERDDRSNAADERESCEERPRGYQQSHDDLDDSA